MIPIVQVGDELADVELLPVPVADRDRVEHADEHAPVALHIRVSAEDRHEAGHEEANVEDAATGRRLSYCHASQLIHRASRAVRKRPVSGRGTTVPRTTVPP